MDFEKFLPNLKKILSENKIKDISFDEESNLLTFKHKKFTYFFIIESEEECIYGIKEIEGTNYSQDFLNHYMTYETINFFEDFVFGIIQENHYEFLLKIWQAFEKLSNTYDEDEVTNIAGEFFDLY